MLPVTKPTAPTPNLAKDQETVGKAQRVGSAPCGMSGCSAERLAGLLR